MYINLYFFPDYGGDEEERWSYVRCTASDAERRGAGKDLPFSHCTSSSSLCVTVINQEKRVYFINKKLAIIALRRRYLNII